MQQQTEHAASTRISEHGLSRDLASLSTVLSFTKRMGPIWMYHNYSNLRQLSQRERRFLEICCKQCAPNVRRAHPRDPYFNSIYLYNMNLTKSCVHCDIIRQVRDKLAGDRIKGHTSIQIPFRFSEDFLRLYFDLGNDQIAFRLYSKEPQNPRNPYPILVNEVCLDPRNAQLIQTLKGWIDDCVNTHKHCVTYMRASRASPKRLIRVGLGDIDMLQLCLPTEFVRYVALTYCWGKCVQPVTKQDNVAARLEGFSALNLPQTIKDAIFMTQELGIQYLWIDSLCIVQDDIDDWASESAKMADVYSGAYVVLAATLAKDVTAGFLHPRDLPLTIRPKTAKRDVFSIQARQMYSHISPGVLDVDNLPLMQRSWCMQERLLAGRIVHFLPDELYFQCTSSSRCECGLESNFRIYPECWYNPSSPEVLVEKSKVTLIDEWSRLVESYSRLQLSYPEDILPAFAGIARRFEPIGLGIYIAGMWEHGLAYQLGWTRRIDLDAHTRTIAAGPTFSWITSSGPVLYNHAFEMAKSGSPLCSLLAAKVVPATLDPYGRLQECSISLRGRSIVGATLAATMEHVNLATDPLQNFDFLVVLDTGVVEHWRLKPRVGLGNKATIATLDWASVTCFGVMSEGYPFRRRYVTMLLLQPAVDKGSFVRIGLVARAPEHWFEKHAVEAIVTLV